MTALGGALNRRAVVARLLRDRQDLAVVTGLGSATYDAAAAGDHPRNFYLWGAMGGTTMVGLGLALAQPRLPVLVLTGDGDLLMGLGSLATIGVQNPPNLTIAVLDNGRYGETGGQASHTAKGTDLAAVARACGIAEALVIADEAALEGFAARVHRIGAGTAFAVLKVEAGEDPRVLPSRDGAFLKDRFRAAIGSAPGTATAGRPGAGQDGGL
jgi:thiamine pyrophosphate-dependent acetolactate synthase large subunit-like protein